MYDNYILMGDFNARLSNNFVDSFCRSYSYKSLIKKSTCFKSPDNPTCIDLILTNSQKYFQNSTILETGLSNFHKLTVTAVTLRNSNPRNLYIVMLGTSLSNSLEQNL